MSSLKRIISGSAASSIGVGITLVSQIALVPIYLTHWSVEVYGVWLAIQALVSVVTMLDFGHQNYVGFEFIKIGSVNKRKLSEYISSSVLGGLFLGLIQFGTVWWLELEFSWTSLISIESQVDPKLWKDVGTMILINSFTWFVGRNIPGILSRALVVFGFNHRNSWWYLAYQVVTTVAPVAAVSQNCDLLTTCIVTSALTLIYSFFLYVDLLYLLKKNNVRVAKPSLQMVFYNLFSSTALSLKYFLENFRHQGVRVILAPFVGPSGLTSFSTMRTGANVALQGLNTIMNQLSPELMQSIHKNEDKKVEVLTTLMWIIAVVVLSPVVIVLQVTIEPFFAWWTKSQIAFDPILFALFSSSILIFGFACPLTIVIIGNNLIRVQLLISTMTSVVLFLLIWMLTPKFGLKGAGIGLFLAEVISTLGFYIVAKKWIIKNNFYWPQNQFVIIILNLLSTIFFLFLIAKFESVRIELVIIFFIVQGISIGKLFQSIKIIRVRKFKGSTIKLSISR